MKHAALAVGRRLKAGMIGVNKGCGGASGTPWVGARESGYGFHHSRDGHRQFTQARVGEHGETSRLSGIANMKPRRELKSSSAGDHLEVEVQRLAYGGDGVGRSGPPTMPVVFVAPHGSRETGHRCRDHRGVQRRHARGSASQQLLARGPATPAGKPPCPVYDACGGCHLMHMNDDGAARHQG